MILGRPGIRRRGIFWYVDEGALMPWYLGGVRPYELCIQCTVIPLNIIASWWFYLLHHSKWKWTAGPRWRYGRRALKNAGERAARLRQQTMQCYLDEANERWRYYEFKYRTAELTMRTTRDNHEA